LGAKYGLISDILHAKGLLSINKDSVEEEDHKDQCDSGKNQQVNAPAKEEVVYKAAEEAKDMGIDNVESNDKDDDEGGGLVAEFGVAAFHSLCVRRVCTAVIVVINRWQPPVIMVAFCTQHGC